MKRVDLNNSCYVKEMVYPGYMLNCPYILHDSVIYPIKMENENLDHLNVGISNEIYEPIDYFLESIGEPLMKDRICFLAYGANRNPENIAWKLKHYSKDISSTVIVIPAKVHNADVVAANIYYTGHFFGDLLFSHEYSEGVAIEAVILLLDIDQVKAFHKSEEVPSVENITEEYWGAGVAKMNNVYIGNRFEHQVDVLAYVSAISIFVSPITNTPVAFKDVKANNRKLIMGNQYEMYLHLEKYDYISNLVNIDTFRKDLYNYRSISSKDAKKIKLMGQYNQVINYVKQMSLKDINGNNVTGIATARREEILLTAEETWNIPKCFYYDDMIRRSR